MIQQVELVSAGGDSPSDISLAGFDLRTLARFGLGAGTGFDVGSLAGLQLSS